MKNPNIHSGDFMIIGGSSELPMWFTDGFLVTFLEDEGIYVSHMWKGHSYVGITHMWELLMCGRGIHMWELLICGRGIHMWELLTCGRGIHVWNEPPK